MVNATVSHILDDPIGSLHDVGEMTQHLTTSPTRSALKTRPMTASAATRLPNVQFGGSSSSDAHQSNNPRPAANGTNHGSLLMSPGKTAAEGGKANLRSTRPQTAGSSRYQVLRAGPTMGGNILETTCKTHPRPKPPPFNNFLVFVVDVEDAERMQAAKTVEEMSEDILDALGLKLPHGKELQAIYAGYLYCPISLKGLSSTSTHDKGDAHSEKDVGRPVSTILYPSHAPRCGRAPACAHREDTPVVDYGEPKSITDF
eukprot:g6142.t1